ncbi:MAG: DUF4157 domain-containing protein, partial [Chloroflexi bacterium]|nr:DUF4157 domain-containing protein [Chloroflexota bacterium]
VRKASVGPPVETDAASEVGQRDSTGELEDGDVQLEPLDIQRQELTPDEEDDLLQAKPLDVQRQELTSDEEEDLLQAKPLDVRRQVGLEGGLVEPDIESDINAARGRGQSIPDTLRESMESSFGADFGGVRLHSDATSDSLNENLNSRAFTVGQDIFVRRQDAGLTSAEGKELLAHELTHVVQQNGPTVRRDDEKKSGVRAAASWTIDKIEKGVGWVSENIIDKWGNAAKTWLQKKLSAAWAVLRKKYPWIATFLEGVLGVVVNLAQMGWSGLKLIARIAWFILKAFGKSILSNIGKVIDIGWKFLSGKSWEEVDLFGDTRAWFKDWNEHKKNPMLWAEFLGVWTGNFRDTTGWIALITGLLALIPGPQSPVFGAISGVSGIITLVLSGIAAGVSSVDLFSNFIHYANNLSLGLPVEAIEKRMKRLSVLVVGDWSSLIGALIGMGTEVIPSETVKQSTGAIIGGFTEGTGDLATGVVEERAQKGTPWSEIWEKIRAKGEIAWKGLFTNLNRLIGLIKGIAKLVAVGFKAVGMIFGGLATVVGGIFDLIAAARSKKKTGEWNLNWGNAKAMVERIKVWNQWEKDKFFPGIWHFGDLVEDVMTWATTEKGNLFKKLDGTGKRFREVRDESKAKRQP